MCSCKTSSSWVVIIQQHHYLLRSWVQHKHNRLKVFLFSICFFLDAFILSVHLLLYKTAEKLASQFKRCLNLTSRSGSEEKKNLSNQIHRYDIKRHWTHFAACTKNRKVVKQCWLLGFFSLLTPRKSENKSHNMDSFNGLSWGWSWPLPRSLNLSLASKDIP